MNERADKEEVRRFDLWTLASKYHPGITSSVGSSFAQAASVCLSSEGHQTGVRLTVEGDFPGDYVLNWKRVTEQMRRCHADERSATEDGACGVAVLLADDKLELAVIQRARIGTGFDWWLGTKGQRGPYFQSKARMEVSGIRRGDGKVIKNRVSRKITQTEVSDDTKLPAFVVIVEFGTPRSRMVKTC